jgi:MOSC domain-containing protein YiiM
MQLISVNTSAPKDIEYRGHVVRTGIFKVPVEGRHMLHELNVQGDGQADLVAHGGTYKAVYAYPHEHYATWQNELGRNDFSFGQFGENFTVTGLLETTVYIGNSYRVGEALVQVTQPRVPCYKLALRMDDPTFVKRFLHAERSGFYLRVLEEGEVGAGDVITLEDEDPQRMTVRDINHLLYFDQDPELVEKALKIEALAPGWKGSFENILAQAETIDD